MENQLIFKPSLWYPGELEDQLKSGQTVRFALGDWRSVVPDLPVGTYAVKVEEWQNTHPVTVRMTGGLQEKQK